MRGWPVTKQSVPLCVPQCRVFRDKLCISDDKFIHASHMGAESCHRKPMDILFWPQMSHDIKNHVSQCDMCNELQTNLTKKKTTMLHIAYLNGFGVKVQLMSLLCIIAIILLLLIFSLIIGNLMN